MAMAFYDFVRSINFPYQRPVYQQAFLPAEPHATAKIRLGIANFQLSLPGMPFSGQGNDRIGSIRIKFGAVRAFHAGLVEAPVIAVPTSIGYGASFGGIAALLGMLNSCANGVAVVNIDNGFGAACVASAITHG